MKMRDSNKFRSHLSAEVSRRDGMLPVASAVRQQREKQSHLQIWEDEGGSVSTLVTDGVPTRHGQRYYMPFHGWPRLPSMASM